ncbi:ScpA family protein [Abiotrophia defectiva]|uniref:segregation and condensation protein A n=1 Tax=Abiotrophia defectiva TaxID=46125 RepID=UPI0026F21749|nr:segregation/condensation protein A [Abiotrophia defectiva]
MPKNTKNLKSHQGQDSSVTKDKQQLKLQLASFQGPFDLLLHLIKQMKVDINDIPMAEITSQYLAYLHSMQELELDQAGDYLVMAATLLEIKSRLLLPIEPDAELDGDYEPGDPRQVLVQQLLLYQQFQDVSSLLEMRQEARAALFSKQADDLSDYQDQIPLQEGEISLDQLVARMQDVLARQLARQPLERQIHHDPLTVEQKMDDILARLGRLERQERLSFEQLIEKASRPEIITTFMALLELVRKQFIVFYQAEALAPIEIEKIDGVE